MEISKGNIVYTKEVLDKISKIAFQLKLSEEQIKQDIQTGILATEDINNLQGQFASVFLKKYVNICKKRGLINI